MKGNKSIYRGVSVLLVLAFFVSMVSSIIVTKDVYAAGRVSVISMDCSATKMNTDFTEGEAKASISATIKSTGITKYSVTLSYYDEKYNSMKSIGDGSKRVRLDRKYYAGITVDLKEGYTWNDEWKVNPRIIHDNNDTVPIYVNGSKTGVKYYYHDGGDYIIVFYPLTVTKGDKPIEEDVITTVTELNISFDKNYIDLSPEYTEGEVLNRVLNNLSCSTKGVNLGHTFLVYRNSSGGFYGVGDGNNVVSADKDYYIFCNLSLEEFYQWGSGIKTIGKDETVSINSSKCNGFNVIVNGIQSNLLFIDYSSYSDQIGLYIPYKSTYDISSVSIAGIEDKDFTGSAITQSVILQNGSIQLFEGKDYKISYSDNVNVGTATMTITGMGYYVGTVTKTFKIKAKSSSGSGNNTNNDSEKRNTSYSNEWINGKWYDADGKQTYDAILTWKSDSTGWWVEDDKGWYPVSSWQRIDGIWYYFGASGYMASNEYVDGYWLNSDGSCSNDYYLTWKSNSTGWWVEDKSGWWPSSQWLKIDGSWYYFDASGYMVTSQYVDGYWIGANGVCN